MRLVSRIGFLFLVLLWAVNVFPQVTTGTPAGTVTSQGNPSPGVTVTISSTKRQSKDAEPAWSKANSEFRIQN